MPKPCEQRLALRLPVQIQRALVAYYQLDDVPNVVPFIRAVAGQHRERVLVTETAGGTLELCLELPEQALNRATLGVDLLCQVVEGVSHFLLLADRARRELPATQLELELQAEVDKWLLLVSHSQPRSLPEWVCLRRTLFEYVNFATDGDGEREERYRIANRLAGQLTHKLELRYLRAYRWDDARKFLRSFFRCGQREKLALAVAA